MAVEQEDMIMLVVMRQSLTDVLYVGTVQSGWDMAVRVSVFRQNVWLLLSGMYVGGRYEGALVLGRRLLTLGDTFFLLRVAFGLTGLTGLTGLGGTGGRSPHIFLLAAPIFALVSGDTSCPIKAAVMFARYSGERIFPLCEVLILALVSGECTFPLWDALIFARISGVRT